MVNMKFYAAIRIFLVTIYFAHTTDAKCPRGSECSLDGMAEVVSQMSLTVRHEGKTGESATVRKVLYLQRNVHPVASAEAFCKEYSIVPNECARVKQMAADRHATAVAKLQKDQVVPSVHLIVQYYNDDYDKRRDELLSSLRFNLNNPHIVKVHNLIETNTVMPQWAAQHPKSVVVRHGPRLTFRAAFEYASQLPPNTTVILANSDTYLDHSSAWNAFTGPQRWS